MIINIIINMHTLYMYAGDLHSIFVHSSCKYLLCKIWKLTIVSYIFVSIHLLIEYLIKVTFFIANTTFVFEITLIILCYVLYFIRVSFANNARLRWKSSNSI